MKKVYSRIGILFLGFFLVGCGNTASEESLDEDSRDDMDIFDFYYINQAPEATEKHPLDELIKIYHALTASQYPHFNFLKKNKEKSGG